MFDEKLKSLNLGVSIVFLDFTGIVRKGDQSDSSQSSSNSKVISHLSSPRVNLVHRCHGEDLKIYFEKTSKEEESSCKDESIQLDCSLLRDLNSEKIRILKIPSRRLAVHLLDTPEEIEGKQQLQFQASYNKELDILTINLIPKENMKKGSITTYEAIEDSLIIETSEKGIVGFELIGAKYLVEMK
jgi:uncharacterized protein YuzE